MCDTGGLFNVVVVRINREVFQTSFKALKNLCLAYEVNAFVQFRNRIILYLCNRVEKNIVSTKDETSGFLRYKNNRWRSFCRYRP